MAPARTVPSGIWTLHPDGYYVRYDLFVGRRTKVQIYVPAGFITGGKIAIYDATNDIYVSTTGSSYQTNYSLNQTTTQIVNHSGTTHN
jgi:hypothetical protein